MIFVESDSDSYETIEKSHGRIEKRCYYVVDGEELTSATGWKGLKSLGMVVRERTIANKQTREVTYYILSFEIDAKLFARCAREHWGIENSLHWGLDVIFREDKLRYRDKVGARNLAAIRKIVMGALAKDKAHKYGKAAKRLYAASSSECKRIDFKNFFLMLSALIEKALYRQKERSCVNCFLPTRSTLIKESHVPVFGML